LAYIVRAVFISESPLCDEHGGLTDRCIDIRAILVAGVGFFLDSYDIFAINLITTLLGVVFWGEGDRDDGYGGNSGTLPSPVDQALKASTSTGIIIGMILFGWLAEYAPHVAVLSLRDC
jgi:hypothetical protein